MRLSEVKKAKEDKKFQLYRIYGSFSESSYYGYTEADKNPLAEFKKQLRSGMNSDLFPAKERGPAKLVASNNGHVDDLKYEHIEDFDNEFEAFKERNEMRRSEKWRSITGPSMFPVRVAKQADPDLIKTWKQAIEDRKTWDDIISSKTARKAYQLGAWTYQDLKKIGGDQNEVTKDLDSLTPFEFAEKYHIKLEPPK